MSKKRIWGDGFAADMRTRDYVSRNQQPEYRQTPEASREITDAEVQDFRQSYPFFRIGGYDIVPNYSVTANPLGGDVNLLHPRGYTRAPSAQGLGYTQPPQMMKIPEPRQVPRPSFDWRQIPSPFDPRYLAARRAMMTQNQVLESVASSPMFNPSWRPQGWPFV